MWMELANRGNLVLGLAISAYTIYSFAEAWILRRRQRYALLKNVHEEFSYFLALASALALRANQAQSACEPYLGGSYPPPATDKDTLPPDAEILARWLVKRADHLVNPHGGCMFGSWPHAPWISAHFPAGQACWPGLWAWPHPIWPLTDALAWARRPR